MYDVVLNHQVLIDEFTPIGVVRHDPAYLGRSQDHVLRLLRGKKGLNSRLVPQIQLLKSPSDQVRIPLTFQVPPNRRPHKALMASYIYLRFSFHFSFYSPQITPITQISLWPICVNLRYLWTVFFSFSPQISPITQISLWPICVNLGHLWTVFLHDQSFNLHFWCTKVNE